MLATKRSGRIKEASHLPTSPQSCLVYKSIVDLVMATFGSSNYSGVGRKEDGLEILFYEGLVTLSQNPQQDPGDLIGTTL